MFEKRGGEKTLLSGFCRARKWAGWWIGAVFLWGGIQMGGLSFNKRKGDFFLGYGCYLFRSLKTLRIMRIGYLVVFLEVYICVYLCV